MSDDAPPRFPSGRSGAHPLEALALRLLAGSLVAAALLWLTGQLSGRLFGGGWPGARPPRSARSRSLPAPRRRPRAGVARVRAGAHARPGRFLHDARSAPRTDSSAAWAWFRRARAAASARADDARWARTTSSVAAPRAARSPGRLTLGRVDGRLVAAEARQSVIVIGPTQTGKTTGFAIPAILEWPGPVVATSVKTDLLRDTLAARSRIPGAKTSRVRPHAHHGPGRDRRLDAAHGLPHLAGCPADRKLARPLRRGARGSGSRATRFWYAAAEKLLAPLLLAAACSGGTMARRRRLARHAGERTGRRPRSSSTAKRPPHLASTRSRCATSGPAPASTPPPRPSSSPTPTPASSPPPQTRGTAARAPSRRRTTPPTCARPRTSSAAYSRSSPRSSRRSSRTPTSARPRPAAARPAAAAGARRMRQHRPAARSRHARLHRRRPGHPARHRLPGHGPDQRRLRPDRAPTIVSNHRAKVILSGISDMPTLDYVAQLLGDREVRRQATTVDADGRRSTTESVAYRDLAPENLLREMRPGHGILVYGHLPAGADRAAPVVQGSQAAPPREEEPAPYGSRATVRSMLDDLTTLPAKRREKRLETLAEDALPCQTITVFDGNPDDGITVALHVDSRRRGDVLTSRVSSRTMRASTARATGRSSRQADGIPLPSAAPGQLRAAGALRLRCQH